MKRMGVLICAAAIMGAGCDSDNPTAPSNLNQMVFTAQLSAANEVPLVTNTESSARGNAQMTFNLTRDASNAITGGTVTFVFNLSDFPANSTVIAAHIHVGNAGVAGGVRIGTPLSPATAITLPNGTANNVIFADVPVVASGGLQPGQLLQAIIDNPSGWYFNVHSPSNPSGVVRGQLVRVQ